MRKEAWIISGAFGLAILAWALVDSPPGVSPWAIVLINTLGWVAGIPLALWINKLRHGGDK